MRLSHQCQNQLFQLFLRGWFRPLWLAGCLYSSLSLGSEQFPVDEVAPGIYLHQGLHEQMTPFNHGDIVNSGFIIGSNAVAVVDPGGSVRNARLLNEAIRTHTKLPVRYVILTHIHPDHMAGVSIFPESSEVIAHTDYPRALAQRGSFYFERFPVLFGGDRARGLRAPDTLVDGDLQIDLGQRLLLIRSYSTAHTDNDLSVFDENTKTLFASDLLFAQRTPSLDGSLSGWLRVLQQMQEVHYELVIPGHGQPGSWSTVVAPQLKYLKALQSSVADQIERGFTLTQAIESGTLEPNLQGWQLFEQVHPVNISKAYTELEWD